MTLQNNKHQKQLFYQYNFFKITFVIVQVMLWGYYDILLFKQTGSIQVIAIDHLLLAFGIWVGFIISSFYLDKLGYLKSYRLMLVLNSIFTLSFLLFLDNLYKIYILIGLLRGILQGLFWSLEHSFKLKEIHGQNRADLLNISFSIEELIRVIIPILAGSLIAYTEGYDYIFLLGGIVYLLAAIFPFNYNKKPRSKIRSEEITQILNTPHFKTFMLINMFAMGFSALFGAMFSIVPYIILKSEFEVGMLGSFVGISVALLSLLERRIKFSKKIQLGYLGVIIYVVSSIVFAIFWSIPFLIIRSFSTTITGVLSDIVNTDLNYRIREILLAEKIQESAIEMNIIAETSYLIGRVVVLGIFIIILSFIEINIINLIRMLIATTSFYLLISYVLNVRLGKKLSKNHPNALFKASKTK